MNDEQSANLKYRIGPPPDLLQEIGQIMVNYSECERAIYGIFRNVMSLGEQDAYLLVKHANLNAEKMTCIIRAEISRIKPQGLIKPLLEALDIFKLSIEHRNIVAHWQWAVTEGDSGLAFNSLKAKPGAQHEGRAYNLVELKATAWRLTKAAILLDTVSITMFEVRKSVLSYPSWAPNNYRNETALDEFMINITLSQTREKLEQVEQAQSLDVQPSSADISRP